MGQFQDTIYHEHPVVIRDVTASQFAAQAKGAPQHPGIRYRVDGQTEYQWNGAKWVAMVSAEQSVTGGIELSAGGIQIDAESIGKEIRQVATRSFAAQTLTSGTKQIMSRTTHFTFEHHVALKFVFPTWYINGNVAEVPCVSAMTLRASIEKSSGEIVRITFNGSDTVTSSGDFIESDWIVVNMPPGRFRVRTWQSSEWGVLTSGFPQAATNSSWGDVANLGTTSIDLTGGGAITSNLSGAAYYPCAILGIGSVPAYLLLGDSRVVGATDGYNNGTMCHGDIARYVGKRFPFINAARGGDTATACAASMTRRASLAAYCNRSIIGYGINDLIARALSASGALNAIASVLALLPERHSKHLLTVTPVSSSTDSWATTENQTTHSSNANRATLNASIRLCNIAGQTGFIEVADYVETSRDSGIWRAGFTADGTHSNSAAATEIESKQVKDF